MNDNPSAMNRFRSHIADRLENDRGAVLVEAAICIPLLLLVILGAVEAGLGWEARSSSISGVRTGIIRAAASADTPGTDLRIVQSVIGEVGGDNADRIEWVMIFDADAGSGDATTEFQACAAGASAGCIIYDQSFISQVASTTDSNALLNLFDDGNAVDGPGGPTATYQCDTGIQLDSAWCAGSRIADGDTEIGVAIRYNHEWISGIFPFDPPTFEEFVVTSTFASGGTDVNSGAPPALPFVAVNAFDSVTDLDSNENFSFSGPFSGDAVQSPPGSSESYLGPVASGEISLVISNQNPGDRVCVDFDLYALGSWDLGAGDTFNARIESDGSVVNQTADSTVDPWRANDSLGFQYGIAYGAGMDFKSESESFSGLCAEVPDSGRLTVVFAGDLRNNTDGGANTNVVDEAFAIDNLVVSATQP